MSSDVLRFFFSLWFHPLTLLTWARWMRNLTLQLKVTCQRKHLLDLDLKLLGKSGHVLGAENVSNYLAILGVSHSATAHTRHFPPPTLKCVWTTETVFLVLMSSHKLSTYCIFFSQLFDVLEGASSLSKKPQCQMCLKQKPWNIWSSVSNSQAETWQEVLP